MPDKWKTFIQAGDVEVAMTLKPAPEVALRLIL